jgi:hypothetical protein
MYSEEFTTVTKPQTVVQRVGRRALTAEVQVRSQDTPEAVRSGRSDSLTGFRLSTSDTLCYYDSTNAAHSYVILLSPTLYYLRH